MPLSPIIVTIGVLLGILGGDVGWCHFTAVESHFPAAWDRKRLGGLLAGGILFGEAEQILGGVPKNIIQFPKGPWLLCDAHVTPRRLWFWSIRITAVSLLVVMSTPVWVTHTTFVLQAQAP
jgi:hypothetical protein